MATLRTTMRWQQSHPLRRAAMGTFGVASVLGGLAVLCGWPYFRLHLWAGGTAVCCCASLGAVGVFMCTGYRTRTCGTLLAAAGAAWCGAWVASWDTGVLPIVGQFSQPVFYLAIGVAVLSYVDPIRREWPERVWICAAVLILLVGTAATVALSRPEWLGYRPAVFWPNAYIDKHAFAFFIDLMSGLYILLAAAYDFVLFRRARRKLPGLQLGLTVPLLIATCVVALLTAFSESGATLTNLNEQLRIYTYQGAFAALMVSVLLSEGLIQRWAELMMKNRITVLATPPTLSSVRDALAAVFKDPALSIYYRLPQREHYVDHRGQWVRTLNEAGQEDLPSRDRWLHPVPADDDLPMAMLDLDPRLRDRQRLLSAADFVVELFLKHCDLRDELQVVERDLVRQAQISVLATDFAERRRIERDLHDGAQQLLLAVAMRMGAAAASVDDSNIRELIIGWQRDVRAASDELRNLARGIYPTTLSERGLGAALESFIERQPRLRVVLNIPDRRYHDTLETNLYFSILEALTNVVKHAAASRVCVEIMHAPQQLLVCQITDNGNGDACLRSGGGLEGMVNRIRLLGGDVSITGIPGEGSSIRMVLPCE